MTTMTRDDMSALLAAAASVIAFDTVPLLLLPLVVLLLLLHCYAYCYCHRSIVLLLLLPTAHTIVIFLRLLLLLCYSSTPGVCQDAQFRIMCNHFDNDHATTIGSRVISCLVRMC